MDFPKTEKQVYSPRISQDLIPELYKIAKARKMPMTRLVSTIIADAIKDIKVETRIVKERKPVKKEIFVIAENNQITKGGEKL